MGADPKYGTCGIASKRPRSDVVTSAIAHGEPTHDNAQCYRSTRVLVKTTPHPSSTANAARCAPTSRPDHPLLSIMPGTGECFGHNRIGSKIGASRPNNSSPVPRDPGETAVFCRIRRTPSPSPPGSTESRAVSQLMPHLVSCRLPECPPRRDASFHRSRTNHATTGAFSIIRNQTVHPRTLIPPNRSFLAPPVVGTCSAARPEGLLSRRVRGHRDHPPARDHHPGRPRARDHHRDHHPDTGHRGHRDRPRARDHRRDTGHRGLRPARGHRPGHPPDRDHHRDPQTGDRARWNLQPKSSHHWALPQTNVPCFATRHPRPKARGTLPRQRQRKSMWPNCRMAESAPG